MHVMKLIIIEKPLEFLYVLWYHTIVSREKYELYLFEYMRYYFDTKKANRAK